MSAVSQGVRGYHSLGRRLSPHAPVDRAEPFCHVLAYLSEESHNRFSATEVTNKTLAAEMQELRARLAEAEETARTAERQKNQLQRQLQDFRRRLTPLHLEMQRMVEKVGWLKGGHGSF